MASNQQVLIRSQFGTKSISKYIMRYASREDATESLMVDDYITKYMTRSSATERLKSNFATVNQLQHDDKQFIARDGVAFGNRGISYSREQLKDAASTTQRAIDQGHVAVMPIVSFTHDYLTSRGIVPADMPEPKHAGDYRGKVDQLKLRKGITAMMNQLQKDAGYDHMEWTGCIQSDTKHIHCHLTMAETKTPKKSRLKDLPLTRLVKEPVYQWYQPRRDDVKYQYNRDPNTGRASLYYKQKLVAKQKYDHKGHLAFFNKVVPIVDRNNQPKHALVERGMLTGKQRARMRQTLDRELLKGRNLTPLAISVSNQKTLTKDLSRDLLFSNHALLRKMQALHASLPKNKKMWRARSHAQEMRRPNELANGIVDDLWTTYRGSIRLADFEKATNQYANARQRQDQLTKHQRLDLTETARLQLRQETINTMYRHLAKTPAKQEIKFDSVTQPTTLSMVQLQDQIAGFLHEPTSVPKFQQNNLHSEYRKRAYQQRLRDNVFEARHFKRRLADYDQQSQNGKTSKDSLAVRNYYQIEYDHYHGLSDKYRYLNDPKHRLVSYRRFQAVKGLDLPQMTYDLSANANRQINLTTIKRFAIETQLRQTALQAAVDYLNNTQQYVQASDLRPKQYELEHDGQFAGELLETQTLPLPHVRQRVNADDRYGKALPLAQEGYVVRDIIKDVGQQTNSFSRNLERHTNLLNQDEEFAPSLNRRAVESDDDKKKTAAKAEKIRQRRLQWEQRKQQWAAERRIREQLLRFQQRLSQETAEKKDALRANVAAEEALGYASNDDENWTSNYFKNAAVVVPKGINRTRDRDDLTDNAIEPEL